MQVKIVWKSLSFASLSFESPLRKDAKKIINFEKKKRSY